jgi:hypothetical protein
VIRRVRSQLSYGGSRPRIAVTVDVRHVHRQRRREPGNVVVGPRLDLQSERPVRREVDRQLDSGVFQRPGHRHRLISVVREPRQDPELDLLVRGAIRVGQRFQAIPLGRCHPATGFLVVRRTPVTDAYAIEVDDPGDVIRVRRRVEQRECRAEGMPDDQDLIVTPVRAQFVDVLRQPRHGLHVRRIRAPRAPLVKAVDDGQVVQHLREYGEVVP